MNSPGREHSNKLNIQIADWDTITSNTSISTISESDLQRYGLGINNIEMLEKMVSSGERILSIIELIIEYDIPIISNTAFRARTEMIMEGSGNNLVIILENRVLSNELSDILKDFKSMAVDDDDVKKL